MYLYGYDVLYCPKMETMANMRFCGSGSLPKMAHSWYTFPQWPAHGDSTLSPIFCRRRHQNARNNVFFSNSMQGACPSTYIFQLLPPPPRPVLSTPLPPPPPPPPTYYKHFSGIGPLAIWHPPPPPFSGGLHGPE